MEAEAGGNSLRLLPFYFPCASFTCFAAPHHKSPVFTLSAVGHLHLHHGDPPI
jgi:hypothetical protein